MRGWAAPKRGIWKKTLCSHVMRVLFLVHKCALHCGLYLCTICQAGLVAGGGLLDWVLVDGRGVVMSFGHIRGECGCGTTS
jgi:hypothetical protein